MGKEGYSGGCRDVGMVPPSLYPVNMQAVTLWGLPLHSYVPLKKFGTHTHLLAKLSASVQKLNKSPAFVL